MPKYSIFWYSSCCVFFNLLGIAVCCISLILKCSQLLLLQVFIVFNSLFFFYSKVVYVTFL